MGPSCGKNMTYSQGDLYKFSRKGVEGGLGGWREIYVNLGGYKPFWAFSWGGGIENIFFLAREGQTPYPPV